MSEKQPGSSLGQTPELCLHPEQMLRKQLGLVQSHLAVTVTFCRSGLPGCRLHLSPQAWWSPASMCQPRTFISTPAPHLCCGSWAAACFPLPGDFGGLSASSLPLGTHAAAVTFLSISAML